MDDLDAEWLAFQNQINTTNSSNYVDTSSKTKNIKKDTPKCSDIYISTQTKIAYLNMPIELYKVFWNLKVMDYSNPVDGIIKKSIKINCDTPKEVTELEENIKNEEGNIDGHILNQVNNPNARKVTPDTFFLGTSLSFFTIFFYKI